MANHPNRSCAQAHRSIFTATLAVCSIEELVSAWNEVRDGKAEDRELRLDLIFTIGKFRFDKRWTESAMPLLGREHACDD